MSHSWETPITRHSWASPGSSLPSNILGRMISRGNYFPWLSPPPGWSRHPYFIRMLYLAYINTFLLVRLKCVITEICEIKTEKDTTPACHQPQSIPLNAARNRCELSEQCSISEQSTASSHRAPDRVSFLGMSGSPACTPAHPSASRLGATQLVRAFALIGKYYTNIFLGYESLFESPGVVLGTLSSRVGVGE